MWRNYIVIAWKVLLRRRFFTFASLFGIAFTLMVLMVLVTIAENENVQSGEEDVGVPLLHLTSIYMTGPAGNDSQSSLGYQFMRDYVRTLKTPAEVTVHRNYTTVSTYKDGARMRLFLKGTDVQYWDVLQFQFIEGRPFNQQEAEEGRKVLVINQSTAKIMFGLESALGKDISVNGIGYRVIGVVSDVPVTREAAYADMWTPLYTFGPPEELGTFRGALNAILVPKSAGDVDKVKSELIHIRQQVQFPNDDYSEVYVRAETNFEMTAREMLDKTWTDEDPGAGFLMMLIIGGILLFMMLPAVNLINLNVSRMMERAMEIGVRKAFGASSRALVGQFIFENLILTLLGGLLALAMTPFLLHLISVSDLLGITQFEINFNVFFYALSMILVFGLISGAYPAWKMSRLQPAESLKGGAT